ncbi:MAG: DUF998 domain-containing protein [Candidatus Bathyarchaeota archaeon]|nr:DUF998 domain-containing protein [Candidatus Bathyarchaeota archaeon]
MVAIVIGWVTIFLSVFLHPWFSLDKNALSDLGALNVSYNYVFNFGLILSSISAFLYGLYLIKTLNKLGCVGGTFLILASANLFLVGLYPEGTYPHLLVSVEFFVLILIAGLIISLSLLTLGFKKHGLLGLTLIFAGIILALTIPWPSVGALEVEVLLSTTIWLIIMLHYHLTTGR